MDVGKKDKRMRALSSKKEELEQMLLNNFKRLETTKKDNSYLEDVYDDYKKYYATIIETKNKQVKSLDKLITYLEDSLENETGEMKRNLKNELVSLRNEREKIKKDILRLK